MSGRRVREENEKLEGSVKIGDEAKGEWVLRVKGGERGEVGKRGEARGEGG